jgi:hypothetical protein
MEDQHCSALVLYRMPDGSRKPSRDTRIMHDARHATPPSGAYRVRCEP